MANKIAGKDVAVYINGLIVGCIQTASIEVTTSMLDATTKCSKGDDGIIWMEQVPNINGWTISGSGLIPVVDSGGQPLDYSLQQLLSAQFAQTKVYVTWVDAGQFLYGGDAYLTTTSSEAGFDALATFDFELTGTGKVNVIPVS